MFIAEPLEFVANYIESIDYALNEYDSTLKLTKIQKSWLSFCIMCIFITRTVCWAKFERACIGKYSTAAISWMFKKSKIKWEKLLFASTMLIIRRFDITHGSLAIDETDKKRSKVVKRIYKAHKIKDYNGPQNLNQLLSYKTNGKGRFKLIPEKEVHEKKLQWKIQNQSCR